MMRQSLLIAVLFELLSVQRFFDLLVPVSGPAAELTNCASANNTTELKCPTASIQCDTCVEPSFTGNKVNMVWMKPTWQSSYDEMSNSSCAGVDGAKPPAVADNWFRTHSEDCRPYWLVDMQIDVTVPEVTLYGRDPKTYPDDVEAQVNTVITVNGELCYEFPDQPTHISKVSGLCEEGFFFRPAVNDCVPCGHDCPFYCDNYHGCQSPVLYNVAMRQKVWMPFKDYGHEMNAVDGRTDTLYRPWECVGVGWVDTNTRVAVYMTITLGGPHYVFSVRLHPRLDCCGDRMDHVFVIVWDREELVDLVHQKYFQQKVVCYDIETLLPLDQDAVYPCKHAPMLGYHVILKAVWPSQLHVCELLVMGYPVKFVEVGGKGCETKQYVLCAGQDVVCEKDVCKVSVGKSCRYYPNLCVSTAVCEEDVCKLKFNESCAHAKDWCRLGTQCEELVNFRCLSLPGSPCSTSQDCVDGVLGITCDALFQCRRAQGTPCEDDEECLAGAVCEDDVCTCTDTSIPFSASAICGAFPCNSTNSSCPAHGQCDPQNGVCTCKNSYFINPRNFSCVHYGSLSMSCNITCKPVCLDCVAGLVCENDVCKSPLRGNCGDDVDCSTGLLCDNSTCRLEPDADCSADDPIACASPTVCERGRCRSKPGKSCWNAPCVTSMTCHNVSMLCVPRIGEHCYGDHDLCGDNAVCDYDDICRVEVGQPCNASDVTGCRMTSWCDAGVCRLRFGTSCYTYLNMCASGLVCDFWYQCRVKNGSQCTDSVDCVAGARCLQGSCSCPYTNGTSDVCYPKEGSVGSPCSSPNNTCEQPMRTTCNANDSACTCRKVFARSHSNFVCEDRPGTPCVTSKCPQGLVCSEDNLCEIQPGMSCLGYENLCGKGSVCDVDKVCQVPHGSTCHSDRSCEAGSLCVFALCSCKDGISVPQLSTNGVECGMVTGKCIGPVPRCLDANAQCNSEGKCVCQADYQLTTGFSCGKSLGQQCEEDTECADNMVCDSMGHCRMSSGLPCRQKNDCLASGVCDRHVCKLDLGGVCKTNSEDNCRVGTLCDSLGLCQIPPGDVCNDTYQCSTGALCVGSNCICNSKYAEHKNHICVPKPGRIGAKCGECTVPLSLCFEGWCRCQPGLETMRLPPEKSKQAGVTGMVMGISFGALALVGMVVGFVFLRRKKEQLQEERIRYRPTSTRNRVHEGLFSLPPLPQIVLDQQIGDAGHTISLTSTNADTGSLVDGPPAEKSPQSDNASHSPQSDRVENPVDTAETSRPTPKI